MLLDTYLGEERTDLAWNIVQVVPRARVCSLNTEKLLPYSCHPTDEF